MEVFKRVIFGDGGGSGNEMGIEIGVGWERWLKGMGPKTFTKEFADNHRDFWDWWWGVLGKRARRELVPEDDLAYTAIWPRGGGKSSAVEWACISEGAIIGEGYALYLSGTQDLAEKHVMAVKNRLESDEVAKRYPGLGNARIGKYGQQFGWRQNMLITESGWGIAALGGDVGVRGGKLVDVRPTLIVIDDLDDLHDSAMLVQKKIEVLTRSIFFTGTGTTVILFAQNLIHKNSVLNQMVEGRIKILAKRRQSPPIKAIEGLEVEYQEGRDVIVKGRPVWVGQSLADCQKILDDSGLEAFLAECQQDFAAVSEGLVIPEFDERIHVISWTEFELAYGHRDIPEHWGKELGLDWGSSGYKAHPTVVSAFTTAAENSKYPGLSFLFWGKTYGEGVLVDDVAEEISRAIGGVKYDKYGWRRFRMSHEARSERDTMRMKYGIPVQAASSGKRDGIAMLRHYLRVDRRREHPFRAGVMGRPLLYWVVDDEELLVAKTDRGLARWREEIIDWRWVPQDITDTGVRSEMPVKWRDDAMDSMRMVTQKWLPPKAPLQNWEKLEGSLPPALRRDAIPTDPVLYDEWERGRWLTMALKQKRKEKFAMEALKQQEFDWGNG